jgi:hypothetical protein
VAEQRLPAPALRAVPARAGVVDGDLLADREAVRPGPESHHLTEHLVARRQRVRGLELSRVQVQVGAADTGAGHPHEHLVARRQWVSDVGHLELVRL